MDNIKVFVNTYNGVFDLSVHDEETMFAWY